MVRNKKGVVTVKKFNHDNSGEFGAHPSETQRGQHKFTWNVIIETTAINLPSQLFLSYHLGFHIFFNHGFLEGKGRIIFFFYSLAVLD